ncbi:hypothetical protein ANN_21190 [Periplaneta americana]|uniref:Uncharacterized protein n=1 Tax=Periplaneta americana TaxID=6978 RepID=A0ABQ8SEM9_PERAM|nr:hypothetical protein ANN_21190 [Periplaneta americana]
MKLENENNLLIFERKIVRRIYGPVYDRGEWRKRKNKEIDHLLEGENIVSFIKSIRLRCLGQVVRMEEGRLPKMIVNARIEGERRRVKTKKRWMDGVMRDVTSLGVRSWRAVAGDRVKWRAVMMEAKVHFGL